MTPKEKAKELLSKYEMIVHNEFNDTEDNVRHCKECALIAVDEILNHLLYGYNLIQYWKEVKKEIEGL